MMTERRLFALVLATLLWTGGVPAAVAQDGWYDDEEGNSGEESPVDPEAGFGDESGAGDDADDSEAAGADPGSARDKFPLRILGAFKAGGGGSYLTAPSNIPGAAPFDEGAGGWGAIVGVTVQATAFKGLVGLEIGLLKDWGYSWSQFDFNNMETEWGFDYSTWRFPLMLEVGTPGEGSRVVLGTGFEFAFGGDAETVATPKGGSELRTTAGDPGSTFWLLNLGAEMPVADLIVLTFDIHYVINLDTVSDYQDRFVGGIPANGIIARNDHELRLMLGVGYAYDLEI